MNKFDVTEFTPEQQEMLKAPLDANLIKQRPGGGGRQLMYVSGDTAIDAANRIFGYGRWGYKILARSHEVIEDEKKGRIEFYTADIELSVSGAMFPFPGDGIGIVNAPFTVEMHEKARKEATTDALKRALRHYGDQFGLSLYDKDDYVDDNGTLVTVGEFKPNGKREQQPKRVIESKPAPKQIQSAATPDKERLNALYDLAVSKGKLVKGAKAQAFLDLCTEALGITVAHVGHLTPSRLDAVEKWLKNDTVVVEEAKAS